MRKEKRRKKILFSGTGFNECVVALNKCLNATLISIKQIIMVMLNVG